MTDLMHPPTDIDNDVENLHRLHDLGDAYLAALDAAKHVSAEIEHLVEVGSAAGYSLSELSDASGLSVSQIEYILVSVDVQNRLDTDPGLTDLRATA
jgi:UDP-glucose 4-epimerase